MVGRILESMMPVMVKELSYRIVEELKRGDNIDLEDLRECGLNPEEYWSFMQIWIDINVFNNLIAILLTYILKAFHGLFQICW